MANPPFSEKELLRAATFFLGHLKKEKGQVIIPEFPEGFFPPELSTKITRNFLSEISKTSSLEELLEKKEEVVNVLDELSQEQPPTPVVLPKTKVVISPLKEKRERTRIMGAEEIKEIIKELTKQIKRIQGERKEETLVYKEEPLTATETAVQATIETIREKVQQSLKTAVEENPTLKRKIKQPLETIAQETEKAVKSQLENLTEARQAVNWVQKTLEDAGLPRDEAYSIAQNTIPPKIESIAIRHQVSLINKRNQGIQAATELIQQSLAKVSPDKIPFAEKVINKIVDSTLTEELAQKDSRSVQQFIETAVRQALSKDGLSSESIDSVTKVIASLEASRIIQELAQTTDKWNALPPPVKLTAFQQTVPRGAEKAAFEIKGLILYGFGKSPSEIEKAKAETLAAETARRLIERGTQIAKLRERGLRARIPAEEIPAKEFPSLVEETITAFLDPEKYGLNFTETVRQEIKKVKELPAPLSQSIEKLLKMPFSTSPEKERAIAAIKEFIRENIPGGVLPKERPQLNKIAEAIIEKIEREFQIPISTKEISEMVKEAITDCLREESGNFARKAERGTKAITAERLPPSLLEKVEKFLRRSPVQLSEWELEQIEELVNQGVLSREAATVYQKEIIRREKTNAFLSPPASAPGFVSRISEKALASYLASDEKREKKEKLSKTQQDLLEQAKEVAPKNKAVRSLLNRLFRLFTKEKNPFKTLKNISELGPSEINLPSQFKREIFRRFINAFFRKTGWRNMDKSTGKSYSRFGRRALKEVLSRLFSPVKKWLTQGVKKIFKTVGRLLGKIIKPVLSALGKLIAPALKALVGFLANTLVPFLLGLASQIGSFLLGLTTALTSFVSLPVVFIVLAAIIIVVILVLIFQGFLLPGAFVDYSQVVGHGTCILVDSTASSQLLILTFQLAGEAFKVPPGVIAGVAKIEGSHLWGYTDTQITTFSVSQAQDPYNCESNQCGARGPMQFLTGEGVDKDKCPQAVGVDVWSKYKEAVNEALNEGRIPHVCNIKDSIFAAAKKLKGDSQTMPENDCAWNKEQVYNAARGYYGKCEYRIETERGIITGNYCEQVWQYYFNQSQGL